MFTVTPLRMLTTDADRCCFECH